MGSIWFNNIANFIWLSTHNATGPAHLEARLMAATSHACAVDDVDMMQAGEHAGSQHGKASEGTSDSEIFVAGAP